MAAVTIEQMKLTFISKKHEIDNAYSFQFKPAEPLQWLAGQSIRLEINGQERRFSIVSAPYEKNIAIATRLSTSVFKQTLGGLRPGDEIDGYSVEGTFLWEKPVQKNFLFAGGVGITPYYSMLKQLSRDNRPLTARLVYANRDDHFLFGDELRQLNAEHPEFELEFLPGRRIDANAITRHAAELAHNLTYVSGPEAMVKETATLLLAAGSTEQTLKRDLFTGRQGWDE